MAAYASGRSGLAVKVSPGDRGGSDDFNQIADSLMAGKRVLVDLLGGEAIYAGGAANLADIVDGTQYPAVTLVIADDAGNPWLFRTMSPTAIVFNVTTTAVGEARLYAVPGLLPGVSPAAADGRHNQVRFVADDAANTAPAHALLLGTGTIANGALTNYMVVSTAPATSAIAPKAHAASHADSAADALTPASIRAVKGPGTVTDGRLMAFDGPTGYLARQTAVVEADLALLASAQSFTARKTFANGLRSMAADASFGPPVSGTHVAGDEWLDAAGTLWLCTAGGTPGNWLQRTVSGHSTWTGGGAGDITAPANWSGGAVLAGYRVIEPTVGTTWVYNATHSRWVAAQPQILPIPHLDLLTYTSTRYGLWLPLALSHDLLVDQVSVVVGAAAGTWDASNYWTLDVQKASANFSASTSLGSSPVTAAGYGLHTPTLTNNLVVTGTHSLLAVRFIKTGTLPPNLNAAASALCRLVRI